ncbi:hypothetical protein EYF80_017339 [Liparis tanakae]|uniref:Uncharacterized protein n=1 Tax=Liparis tanakae TaxID=230148 RepID=A0A4Z2I5B6_9TELE|nr:hypothetical protein EYF80_017339 [Liparis tanakae]
MSCCEGHAPSGAPLPRSRRMLSITGLIGALMASQPLPVFERQGWNSMRYKLLITPSAPPCCDNATDGGCKG